MRCNVRISHSQRFFDRFTLDPFCRNRRGSDGGTAAEGFEFRFNDVSIVVYSDLEFHYVTACWCSDESLHEKMGREIMEYG